MSPGTLAPSDLQSDARPLPRFRNVHLVGGVADVIQQAFQLYGIDVVFVGPIQGFDKPVKLDMRDADLETVGEVLDAMTHCFFVPVNTHLVLAVQDDKKHRLQYERVITKTIEVPNLEAGNNQEQAEVQGLLRTIFDINRANVHDNRVTIRAPRRELLQAEDTLTHLFQPAPQVMLEIKAYIVSHGYNRNLGVQPPQQITIFNVASEAQNLITSNSSVVGQLIASGVVDAGDTLGIAEALIAGGYASNSVLSSPFVTVGGGNTTTGVQFGSVGANMSLSTSSSRQIQGVTLHLANDQQGTLRIGQRYPVMTASTAAIGGAASSAVPSIQYEDLGLILEAKPHIEFGNEVLLHIHESFRSLDGTSLNSIPVIDNQEFRADLSVPAGVTTVVVSNLSVNETRTAQGLLGSVPTNSSRNQQTSDLVVTITPLLTRSSPTPFDGQAHSPLP
jgi:type II secretory pathway component GspD/PulD (secretin)